MARLVGLATVARDEGHGGRHAVGPVVALVDLGRARARTRARLRVGARVRVGVRARTRVGASARARARARARVNDPLACLDHIGQAAVDGDSVLGVAASTAQLLGSSTLVKSR